jgi:tetratricopeptide (TPR) repeat protein
MASTLSPSEEAQLAQTIEMFEVITQSQPLDYQSLEILKEAYTKLNREQDVVNTSKRIAQAYVQMGQLSSAILEYETILQRFPDDPDVQEALKQIESKANNFATPAVPDTSMVPKTAENLAANVRKPASGRGSPLEVEDGRQAMYKLFVDSKLITAGDFDLCWTAPDLSSPPAGPTDPFIQVLHEKGVLPIEKSLKVLAEKSRLAYLPIESYEIDLELARSFPADTCRRWSVLPFDKMSKSVQVATCNPYNQQAAKELAAATQCRLLWYLVTPLELVKNLRKVFR